MSTRLAMAVMFVSLSLCVAAQAQNVTLGQFQHPKGPKDLEVNKAYLQGAIDGLIAYNMAAEQKLFCLPGIVPKLSFDEANDLIFRWARKTSGSSDISLGHALLFGLRESRPCR
jgi:hypothetical protein